MYIINRRKVRAKVGRGRSLIQMQKKNRFDDLRSGEAMQRKGKISMADEVWCLTSRKVLTLGILFSSMRSLKAFSWLLQYSPYTEKLLLCKTEEKLG